MSVGIAVFGAGRIGAVHAANLARHVPGATLAGVADTIPSAAQRLVRELGAGRVDSIENFLSDADVAGVVIATPTGTHAEIVAAAAAAGKHVLCEKPISMDVAHTVAAAQAAEAAGIILQVGFQRRFDAEFAKARDLIESGALGEVRFVRLVGRDRSMPPIAYIRTSGGQFRDQMIHELDAARWLMGPAEVDEVYATGSALVDAEVGASGDVDTAVACLRFSNGAIAVIDSSREAAYGYDSRAEVHGSRGMFLAGGERLPNGEILDGRYVSPDTESFIERFAGAYRAELIDFLDAIRTGRAPRAGAGDALMALRVALAADRSLREKRAVKLADIGES